MKFPTGILGINARNLLYIRPFNKKKAIQLADNKLQSKTFFQSHDIPSAKVYAIIRNKKELETFRFRDIPAKSFVIKPNRGFGGQGIKIILDKENINKKRSLELKSHIVDILDGNYSLTNAPDTAIIEQRIICHPTLAAFSYKGLPDIRVIVHNLIPVMAMLRLPTKESDGKANYHAGGAIAGIDLATGEVTHAVIHGKYVKQLPGQTQKVIGVQIPNWNQILLIATKAQLYSNIGYLAIDIVLNKKEEPLVLEMNARGGLTIQIANKAKLRERLDRIKGLKVSSPERGVRIGKEIFGSHDATQTIETEVERLSGKEILGSYEPIDITAGRNKNYRTVGLLDTKKIYTSLDKKAAMQLGLIDKHYKITEKPEFFRVVLHLGKKKVRTFATIKDYSDHTYKVVVGRRNLRNIFIDPYKGLPGTFLEAPKMLTAALEQEKEADHLVAEIYEKIFFLGHLNPINAASEYEKWQKNHEYMPQFHYKEIPHSYDEILKDLESIPWFESDIGQLIKLRAQEIAQLIQIVKSVGTKQFIELGQSLFHPMNKKETKLAENYIKLEKTIITDKTKLNALEISKMFKQIFQDAELKQWRVQIDEHHLNSIRILKDYRIGVPRDRKVTLPRLMQLTAHEILTHALIRYNGEQQKWRIFAYGFPKYTYTQEGLAAYNEILAAPEYKNNVLKRSAQNALLADYAQKVTGTELMHRLLEMYSSKKAWRTFSKLKRGIGDTNEPGGLGRENIYFLGLLPFLDAKRIPKIYYSGRISQEYLDVAKRFNSLETFYVPKFPLQLKNE